VLDPNQLNYQVGADTVQTIQVAITTVDVVGKTIDPDEAWANCEAQYWFDWSTRVIDGSILSIGGQQRVLQTYCGTRGYQIYGATNTVAINVTGGTPPFALRVLVDNMQYLYQERVDRAISFNLNANGFTKGGHYMQVFWSDSCGWTGSAADSLCVPDSLPPCAEVTNPVDGKCIRRARTMQDPIGQYEDPITITIMGNDLTPGGQGCVDQSGVLKVDFQWAKTCCAGGTTNCTTMTIKDSTSLGGGGIPTGCDSFYTGTHLDSIVCADTTFRGWKYTFRDTTICTPCTDDWHTFAIDSANGTDTYTAADVYPDREPLPGWTPERVGQDSGRARLGAGRYRRHRRRVSVHQEVDRSGYLRILVQPGCRRTGDQRHHVDLERRSDRIPGSDLL
jgi:hypothetical protein